MSEREKVDTYTIPPNFAESGKWFSGRVSAGNVVEAAVMSLILLKILLQVPVDGRTKIYLGIIFILPVVIFAVIGVQGERLTAYLFHILCFLKNRRVLTTPSGRYKLERKRRIERREHKRRKKGGDNHQSGNKGTGRTVKRGKKGRKTSAKRKENFGVGTKES